MRSRVFFSRMWLWQLSMRSNFWEVFVHKVLTRKSNMRLRLQSLQLPLRPLRMRFPPKLCAKLFLLRVLQRIESRRRNLRLGVQQPGMQLRLFRLRAVPRRMLRTYALWRLLLKPVQQLLMRIRLRRLLRSVQSREFLLQRRLLYWYDRWLHMPIFVFHRVLRLRLAWLHSLHRSFQSTPSLLPNKQSLQKSTHFSFPLSRIFPNFRNHFYNERAAQHQKEV